MVTMKLFISSPPMIPPAAAWYLSDLGEALGKQELFTRQSPQKLKTLREHALIESAVSSNRLEGVTVDRSRIATVVFGKSLLRDRDEAEVRGYRDALKLIHESGRKLEINEDTVRQLHTLARANIGDAGSYKEKDSDIIERFPDGRERVRFKTVPAKDTPRAMKDLVELWNQGMEERRIPPPVLLAAWNLDFLCIHPFRDGNGRVSRLLLLLQSYHFLAAIAGLNDDFSIGDVQAKCPGVSVDMIRRVLKKERRAGTVECLGRGRDAKWRRIKPKLGNTQLNG